MFKWILIITFFLSIKCNSQINENPGIRHALCYTPTDYFYQIFFVNTKLKRIQLSPMLGLGINRTLFQRRFYPEAGFHLAYITSQRPFRFLPYAQLSCSRLRITDDKPHFWTNFELGLRAEIHRTRVYGIQAGYKVLYELWNGDQKVNTSRGFGFTAGIYFKL